MATFTTAGRWALRRLTGASLISDIDAGFDALADDVDAKLTPWSAGTWNDRPAPVNPGQRYYVTDLGYEIVADGTDWQLVSSVGIGEFVETLRTSDPPGGFLLLADGRTIPRDSVSPAYSELIGGTSTNINLPDHRGRSTAAPSNMGGTPATGNTRIQIAAGATAGEVLHTLTALESGTNPNAAATNTLKYSRWARNAGVAIDNSSSAAGNVGGAEEGPRSLTGSITLGARAADNGHNTVHPVVGVNKLIRVK